MRLPSQRANARRRQSKNRCPCRSEATPLHRGGTTSLITSRPPDFTRRRKRTNSGLAPVGVRYCNTACGTMRSSECSGSRAISCGATTRIFGLSANRCSSCARKPGAASHNWSSPAAASAISACSALNRSRARALAVGHDRRDLLGDQPVVQRIDVDRMRSVPESKPVGVVRSATARSADPRSPNTGSISHRVAPALLLSLCRLASSTRRWRRCAIRMPSKIGEALLTMGPFIKPTLGTSAAKLAKSVFGWNLANNLAFQPKSQFLENIVG